MEEGLEFCRTRRDDRIVDRVSIDPEKRRDDVAGDNDKYHPILKITQRSKRKKRRCREYFVGKRVEKRTKSRDLFPAARKKTVEVIRYGADDKHEHGKAHTEGMFRAEQHEKYRREQNSEKAYEIR